MKKKTKEITPDELDKALTELLEELDEEMSENTPSVSEEEKKKRKSIWNKISD